MSDKKILIAFFLNICFSVFELFGGIITNSFAIISDAIHDFADAISIGISYFLEKISKRKPDNNYTFGYIRYSVLGALITNTILIVGSITIIINALKRLINPVSINYNGMIIFAIFGVIVNFLAAFFTKDGETLNQKAVNLHMLEDVFGWLIVLIGAFLIKLTKITRIDALLSIFVSVYILIHALKGLKKIIDLFLEKTPTNIDIIELKKHLLELKDINDIHHIHIWSLDGINNYATLHAAVKNIDSLETIKQDIKTILKKYNIDHVTIEIEKANETCIDKKCSIKSDKHFYHNH